MPAGDTPVIPLECAGHQEITQLIEKFGASDRIRTGDIQNHNLAL
jgi:hypothetical protein